MYFFAFLALMFRLLPNGAIGCFIKNKVEINMNSTNLNNPNNDAYWQVKGYKKRPNNWRHLLPKNSKRQLNREKYDPYHGCGPDGRGCIDAMFDPLCKDDY